jgi:hypothetical protein
MHGGHAGGARRAPQQSPPLSFPLCSASALALPPTPPPQRNVSHPTTLLSLEAQAGAACATRVRRMRRTGDPRGSPRIDNERAAPRVNGEPA